MKENVGDIENYTRDGRSSKMVKELERCFWVVVWNKKFVVQLEYIKKHNMSASSLLFICDKTGGLPRRR